jgi:hypothetical protein
MVRVLLLHWLFKDCKWLSYNWLGYFINLKSLSYSPILLSRSSRLLLNKLRNSLKSKLDGAFC